VYLAHGRWVGEIISTWKPPDDNSVLLIDAQMKWKMIELTDGHMFIVLYYTDLVQSKSTKQSFDFRFERYRIFLCEGFVWLMGMSGWPLSVSPQPESVCPVINYISISLGLSLAIVE
jgi:hypothetical protein